MKFYEDNCLEYIIIWIIDHLICEECYLKNFKDVKIISDENEEDENDDNDRNNKVVDLDKGTIFCEICDKKHILEESTFHK